MTKPIKVFGDKAKEIKEGDIFIASVGSVEGHCVITLLPKDTYKQRNPKKVYDITFPFPRMVLEK